MSRRLRIVAAAGFLAGSARAFAESPRGDFLEYDLSARQAGLHGSQSADEPSALGLFRSPTAPLRAPGLRIGAAYLRGLFDSSLQGASVSLGGDGYGVGGGMSIVQTASVPVTDALGQVVGQARVFDSVGILAASARIGGAGAVGASLKGFVSRQGDRATSGFAFDAESRYALRLRLHGDDAPPRVPGESDPVVNLALALRNAGSQGAFVRDRDPLPTAFVLSATLRRAIGAEGRIAAGGTLERPLELTSPYRTAVGAEFAYRDAVSFRLGYRSDETQNRLAAGIGVVFREYTLDLAVQPYGELGSGVWVSVGYRAAGI